MRPWSYCLYPKVVEEYCRHRQGVRLHHAHGQPCLFNGMALGETNKINIEDGKTLVIKYLGLGDLNEDGTRNVQFELNGMRRDVAVPDPTPVQVQPQRHGRPGGQEPGGRLHPRYGVQGHASKPATWWRKTRSWPSLRP